MYILGLIVVPPDRDRSTSTWRIVASDLVLLGLASLAYSGAWMVIVDGLTELTAKGPVAVIKEAIIATCLFALSLVAMRFGFLVEEGIAKRNRLLRVAIWLSILAAIAAAMLPYYFRP
jgi:hypothetical protein